MKVISEMRRNRKNKRKHSAPTSASQSRETGFLLAIGVSVLAMQLFEHVFVMVSKTALKYPEIERFDELPDISDSDFRKPVSRLVSELLGANQVDQTLADRIVLLLRDRNEVIHRHLFSYVRDNGSAEGMLESFGTIARRVYLEAFVLSDDLIQLFGKYVERFPEQAKLADELKNDFYRMGGSLRARHAQVFGEQKRE